MDCKDELMARSQQLQKELKQYDFAQIKDVISQRRGYAERCRQASIEAAKQSKEQLESLTPEMLQWASTLVEDFASIIEIDYERAQNDLEYTVEKQQQLTDVVKLIYTAVKEELDV